MTVQVTNEEQHILWEEYGLRLHIPHDVLPEGQSHSDLTIAVSVSGNFQLPEDCVLVSAVYSVSHDLGDKKLKNPVTLEMQHCATSAASNNLQVLRANDNSNKFEVVAGGIFTYDDCCGKIELYHFSSFAIAASTSQDESPSSSPPTVSTSQDESPSSSPPAVSTSQDESPSSSPPAVSPLEYRAQLYYTNIEDLSFKSELYILPNLEANFKVCINIFELYSII